MSSTLFTERHLKSMIKAAKEGKTIHFAFGETKDGSTTLIADDGMDGKKLHSKLKSEIKPALSTYGQLQMDGTKLVLRPEKNYKGLKKKVTALVAEQSLPCGNVVVLDPETGEEEADISKERRDMVTIVGYALFALLKNGNKALAHVPSEFHPGFDALEQAMDEKNKDGEARVKAFETGVKNLGPVLSISGWDAAMVTWITTNMLAPLKELRAQVERVRADSRIDARVELSENLVMDTSEDTANLHKQLKTGCENIDRIFKILGPALDRAASAAEKSALAADAGNTTVTFPKIASTLEALKVGTALLALTDEELARRLSEVGAGHPLLKSVRTVADLTKQLTDLAAGLAALAAQGAALLAKKTNNLELAAKVGRFTKMAGKRVPVICGAIEVVHGVTVLLDDSSSAQDRMDAKMGITTGSLTLLGIGAKGAGAATLAAGLSTTAIALVAAYAAAKFYADAYWSTRSGVMNIWTVEAFKTLDKSAARIAKSLKRGTAACTLLVEAETDSQKAALNKALSAIHADLSAAMGGLLTLCAEGGYFKGPSYPGSFTVFEEKFAPLQLLKGEKDPEKLVINAGLILDAIEWCFQHASKVIKAAAAGKGVESVEAMIRQEEEAAG